MLRGKVDVGTVWRVYNDPVWRRGGVAMCSGVASSGACSIARHTGGAWAANVIGPG